MLEAKKSVSMSGFSGASSVRPASSRNPRSGSELTHPRASSAGTDRSACLELVAALCQHVCLCLRSHASKQRDLDLLSCPSQLSKSGHPTLKPGERYTLHGLSTMRERCTKDFAGLRQPHRSLCAAFASPMLRTPEPQVLPQEQWSLCTVTTCAVRSTLQPSCTPCAAASCKWQVAVARQPRSLTASPGAYRLRR